jgi:DNA-binding LytR/AlgR family response regulator
MVSDLTLFCIEDIINYVQDRESISKSLTKRVDGILIDIKVNDIVAIESISKHQMIKIHTLDKSYETYGKLKNKENLSNNLLRIHKSCLINMKYIFSINKKEYRIKMINDMILFF